MDLLASKNTLISAMPITLVIPYPHFDVVVAYFVTIHLALNSTF
jgi:hypothetical protein